MNHLTLFYLWRKEPFTETYVLVRGIFILTVSQVNWNYRKFYNRNYNVLNADRLCIFHKINYKFFIVILVIKSFLQNFRFFE